MDALEYTYSVFLVIDFIVPLYILMHHCCSNTCIISQPSAARRWTRSRRPNLSDNRSTVAFTAKYCSSNSFSSAAFLWYSSSGTNVTSCCATIWNLEYTYVLYRAVTSSRIVPFAFFSTLVTKFFMLVNFLFIGSYACETPWYSSCITHYIIHHRCHARSRSVSRMLTKRKKYKHKHTDVTPASLTIVRSNKHNTSTASRSLSNSNRNRTIPKRVPNPARRIRNIFHKIKFFNNADFLVDTV